ncbi:hypothetical protein M404DRAFT_1004340 [Pisolithus tinctorius Marx 270]|uniref:Uncharacterized protein n=1 Tax=Pisolithus tinctorius Marx 270 TaxID=870435 RepID=A0A0C3ISH5_PISTI|nr:hypothetical protein M404DRAFT_1004340 [Pisolithus tinctorius Marx 270]
MGSTDGCAEEGITSGQPTVLHMPMSSAAGRGNWVRYDYRGHGNAAYFDPGVESGNSSTCLQNNYQQESRGI